MDAGKIGAASSAGRARGDKRFEQKYGGLTADRPQALIAAPNTVVRMLRSALPGDAIVTGGNTWDRCVEWLDQNEPSLVLVCYAFDEMRPFRLISHIRDDARHNARAKRLPIVLVRALPVPMRAAQEAEIRESYMTLGITEFVNLRRLIEEQGEDAALEEFRSRMIDLLR